MKKIYILILLLFKLVCPNNALSQTSISLQELSNPYKYGWDTVEKWKQYREHREHRRKLLYIYEKEKQLPITNILKSVITPGWGHFAAKRYTRGQIILGMHIVLLGSSIYYYDRAMDKYDKYKKAKQIDEINQFYNDALTPYRKSQLLFGLSCALWLYTIYDVVTVTEDYNYDLWNQLVLEYKGKEIEITPNGLSIKF